MYFGLYNIDAEFRKLETLFQGSWRYPCSSSSAYHLSPFAPHILYTIPAQPNMLLYHIEIGWIGKREVMIREMILSSLVTLFILKNPCLYNYDPCPKYKIPSPFLGGKELTAELVNSGQTHNFLFIAPVKCAGMRGVFLGLILLTFPTKRVTVRSGYHAAVKT